VGLSCTEEAGRDLRSKRVAEGTSGRLKLLVCLLLTTFLFPGCLIDKEASFGGCVARASPGEGETTPDWITALSGSLKHVSGFVAGRVLALAVDFVLTMFIGLRHLGTTRGITASLDSTLDRREGVARI
jgi:hypothetical protein